MSILFENDYERTPEVTKEIYRHLCFKRPVHIAVYVILGVIATLNLIAALWFWEYHIAPIVYGLLIVLMQFLIYRRNVRIAIARDREQHSEEPPKVHTVVTEEGIRCIYGENKANPIALSSIKKVYKTKNLIVLLTKAQLLLIFDKYNFTVGTQDEFLKYLRENGLKV